MEPMLRPCKPNNLGKGSHGNFYLLIGLSASYQLILNPLTSKKYQVYICRGYTLSESDHGRLG